MTTSKPTVVYFQLGGRAEHIRMLLAHSKTEWEDERLTGEEFGARKAAGDFPSGQIPVYIEDGKVLNQGKAILTYLGAKHGYLPTDAHDLYTCDWVWECRVDMFGSDFYYPWFKAASGAIPSEEDSANRVERFGKFCTQMDKALEHGKPFFCGDKITVADFSALSTLWLFSTCPGTLLKDLNARCLAKIEACPHLHKWYTHMCTVELGDYLTNHFECIM